MESIKFNPLKKLVDIYCIMPFYDYAFYSVQLLRSLGTQTRQYGLENQYAVIKPLIKQTISISCDDPVDHKIFVVLKKNDKYKLFKIRL